MPIIYDRSILILYIIKILIVLLLCIISIYNIFTINIFKNNDHKADLKFIISSICLVIFMSLLLFYGNQSSILKSELFLYTSYEYDLEAIANDKQPEIKYDETNDPYIVHYKNKHTGCEKWIYYLPKEANKEQDMDKYKLEE